MNDALETSVHNAMVVSNIDTSNIETFGRRSTGSLGNVGGQRPSSFDSTYARPSTRPSYDTNVNTRPSYDSNANIRASKSDINTSNRTSYSNDTNTNTRTSYSNDTNINTYPRPKPYEPKRETETDSYVRTTTTTTATTAVPTTTTTSNSTKSYNVPKSLGAEAGDLMDIMGALGDSSMGIGNTITTNINQYTNYNLALGSGLDNSSIVDNDDGDDDDNTMSVESRLKNLVKSSLLDSPHR